MSVNEQMVQDLSLTHLDVYKRQEEYCRRCGVAAEGWVDEIETYETEVLAKRA